jgi:hypothetical protein
MIQLQKIKKAHIIVVRTFGCRLGYCILSWELLLSICLGQAGCAACRHSNKISNSLLLDTHIAKTIKFYSENRTFGTLALEIFCWYGTDIAQKYKRKFHYTQ